jgi:hypothetical protein
MLCVPFAYNQVLLWNTWNRYIGPWHTHQSPNINIVCPCCLHFQDEVRQHVVTGYNTSVSEDFAAFIFRKNVTPCSDVARYQRFGRLSCHHLHHIITRCHHPEDRDMDLVKLVTRHLNESCHVYVSFTLIHFTGHYTKEHKLAFSEIVSVFDTF